MTVTWDVINRGSGVTLSNSNLTATISGLSSIARATEARSTGKWYWEIKLDAGSFFVIGIVNGTVSLSSDARSNTGARYYGANGFKYPGAAAYGSPATSTNIISVLLNLDDGTLEFWNNGVSLGISHTDLSGMGAVYPAVQRHGSSGSGTFTANFGAMPFSYSIPSGYSPYEGLKKTLVLSDNVYKTYNGNEWITVTTTAPAVQEYIDFGIDFISTVPESAWDEFTGNIELHYFTNDLNKTEVLFQVETEPFTFYEHLGNEIDVLCYTKNINKESVELQITTNYSPLDELNDPSLLIWSNQTIQDQANVSINAVPKPQLVIPVSDVSIQGTLNKFKFTSLLSKSGIVKFVFSGDGGLTWNTIKSYQSEGTHVIKPISSLNIDNVKKYGALPEHLALLTKQELQSISANNKYRFAYYISQFNMEDIASINDLKADAIVTTETPKLQSLILFYDELDARYSGLMFMDTSQQYYSTSIGDILKHLDFGTLIAGQTSLDVKVILTNTYPFDVENIVLTVDNNIPDATVELSKTKAPFIAEHSLTFDQQLSFDQTLDFYVRLAVGDSAVGEGTFDIKVDADTV